VDYAFLNRPIKFLSGGQKQRLNLLRTLSLDTELLILDEPLNGLDFLSLKKVIDLLLTKQEEGKGILLISHNEEIFDSLGTADCVYLKAEG
jgi:ABC-type multidrug transport system ATPase subunit